MAGLEVTMSQFREWHAVFVSHEHGLVQVMLYEVEEDAQTRLIDLEEFGPFDTAQDVCRWLTRQWGGSARLPMR